MLFSQLRKPKPQDDTLPQLQHALEEWKEAMNYFENVSDPDLVDYAIFKLETSRRYYRYWLKRVRA